MAGISIRLKCKRFSRLAIRPLGCQMGTIACAPDMEDQFAMVSPAHEVIDGSTVFNAQRSRHTYWTDQPPLTEITDTRARRYQLIALRFGLSTNPNPRLRNRNSDFDQ